MDVRSSRRHLDNLEALESLWCDTRLQPFVASAVKGKVVDHLIALAVRLSEHGNLVVLRCSGGCPAIGCDAKVYALACGGGGKVLCDACVGACVVSLDGVVDKGDLRTILARQRDISDLRALPLRPTRC